MSTSTLQSPAQQAARHESDVAARPTTPGVRELFGRHAGGVAVVTAQSDGRPVGFTATSVVSVSLDPPLLSFGISRRSSSWDILTRSSLIGVHLLGDEQADLARLFATSGADRFGPATRWSSPDGAPSLDDAPIRILGAVEHRLPAGDALIVVARVVDAEIRRPHTPLVHHAGTYGTFSSVTPVPPLGAAS